MNPNQNTQLQKLPPNPPGILALQCLTYTFWGCTLLAISLLINIITVPQFVNVDSETAIVTVVATFILLLISATLDTFYVKYEPQKKQGASKIIMTFYTALFFILSIGSFLVVCLAIGGLILGAGDTGHIIWSLVSFFSMTILSVATLVRIFNPFKSNIRTSKYFIIVVAFIAGVSAFYGYITGAYFPDNDWHDKVIRAEQEPRRKSLNFE